MTIHQAIEPEQHYQDVKPNVVVLIPAYNEERFIGSVVLKTREYVDTVIVIDNGSADDTAKIAEKAGAIVIMHLENRKFR